SRTFNRAEYPLPDCAGLFCRPSVLLGGVHEMFGDSEFSAEARARHRNYERDVLVGCSNRRSNRAAFGVSDRTHSARIDYRPRPEIAEGRRRIGDEIIK